MICMHVLSFSSVNKRYIILWSLFDLSHRNVPCVSVISSLLYAGITRNGVFSESR